MRTVEGSRGQLGHARLVVDVRLKLGDFGKDRQLIRFLKATKT